MHVTVIILCQEIHGKCILPLTSSLSQILKNLYIAFQNKCAIRPLVLRQPLTKQCIFRVKKHFSFSITKGSFLHPVEINSTFHVDFISLSTHCLLIYLKILPLSKKACLRSIFEIGMIEGKKCIWKVEMKASCTEKTNQF